MSDKHLHAPAPAAAPARWCFANAPAPVPAPSPAGVHFLADRLRSLALNSSLPLLSLELAPADPALGLVVATSTDVPEAPPPRLKVKRDGQGGVELVIRQVGGGCMQAGGWG